MAESVDDVRRMRGPADHRKRIRKGGAYPIHSAASVRKPAETARSWQASSATVFPVRRSFEAAQFDRTADPDPRVQRRDDEAVAREDQLPLTSNAPEGSVVFVAALGLERNPIAQRRVKSMRPRAGRDHDPAGTKARSIVELDDASGVDRLDPRYGRSPEARAPEPRHAPIRPCRSAWDPRRSSIRGRRHRERTAARGLAAGPRCRRDPPAPNGMPKRWRAPRRRATRHTPPRFRRVRANLYSRSIARVPVPLEKGRPLDSASLIIETGQPD